MKLCDQEHERIKRVNAKRGVGGDCACVCVCLGMGLGLQMN